MHSEHILKERSDAQNVVSRFPCGDITLLHNPRQSRAPFFNLRPKGNPPPFEPSSPIGRQGGCMVFAAKGGIKNGAEGAVPRQRSDTI